MDYEKKYKEALERAKQVYKTPYTAHWDVMKELIEHLFPELKESEDERIRKALVRFHKSTIDIDGIKGEDILAWLEKQGKNNMGISETTKRKLEDNLNKTLEKETPEYLNEFPDEQKPSEEYNITGIGSKNAQGKLGEMIKNLKPTWSEEDEQLIDEVAVCLRKYAEKVQGGNSKFYVQSLADRIESLRPGNTCKATGWSEEDEAMYQGVIETEQYMLDVVYGRKNFSVGNESIKEECTKELAWLKSLKDRIK